MINSKQHILIEQLRMLPKHGVPSGNIVTDIEKALEGVLDKFEVSKQLAVFDALQQKIETISGALLILEMRGEILKDGFNINTDAASKFGWQIDDVGTKLKINTRLAKLYTAEIAQNYLPGQKKVIDLGGKYAKSLLYTNDIMRNKLKLDAKQNVQLRKLARNQNISIEELLYTTNKFGEALGEEWSGSLIDVLNEISNLSSDIAIQYGRTGIAGNLEKSILLGKRYGLTLQDLYKTGEKMLDVETQTGAAVEYQIYTGKRLEGQKFKNVAASYNQATIEGDSNKQMEIILDLVKTQGTHILNNYKGRQAAAKALGVEESKLVDINAMIQEQFAIENDIRKEENKELLTFDQFDPSKFFQDDGTPESKDRQLKFQEKLAQGQTDLEKRKREVKIADDYEKENLLRETDADGDSEDVFGVGKTFNLQTTLEAFDDLQEQIKSNTLLESDLVDSNGKLVHSQHKLLTALQETSIKVGQAVESTPGKFVIKLATVYGTWKLTAESAEKMVDAVKNMKTSVTKEDQELGAGGKGVKGKDVILSPTPGPGYGTKTLLLPEGSINLKDEDTVIAGTDLGGRKNKRKGSRDSGGVTTQQLVAALSQISWNVTTMFDTDKFVNQIRITESNKMNQRQSV